MDAIEKSLIEVVAKSCGISADRIDPAIPLNKLGIDSLMALSVVSAVEKRFGVIIPEKQLRNVRTVRDLIPFVVKKGVVKIKK